MPSDPEPGRWRVEDLAERARVSVDTIRFYQKRELMAPPERVGRVAWYGPHHEQRLAQIKALQDDGFTLAMIRRVLDGDLAPVDRPLAVAVADAGAGAGAEDGVDAEDFLTIDELARRSGVPAPLIQAVVAEGLLVPRTHDGLDYYTSADIEVVAAGLALLEAGVPLTALLDLARQHHAATIGVAEAAVALFDEHVRQPLLAAELGDDERAARLVGAFRRLLPATGTLVAQHFRRVLLQVAQQHLESVGDENERAAADAASSRRIEDSWPG